MLWTIGSASLMWSIHTVDVAPSPRNYCYSCCYHLAVLVVAPEKPDCARERRELVVLDGSAAAVQEERVQQRHGQWPQHDEAKSKGNDWLVCAGPSALNVERRCQVGLGLAREVVEAEALALEGEEERARHRW
eukprot:scaffold22417_cov67-Phaeocystis_antarctica.AAC.6